MTPACIHQNNTPISASHQNHGAFVMKSFANSNSDRSAGYRIWFRDLLWKAFPADSDADRAIKAAHVLDVSERQVRNWLRCEHDPKLRYVMAVIAIAGAEVVFK